MLPRLFTERGSLQLFKEPEMGNFEVKWEAFTRAFIDYGGYKMVLEGLQNTIIIAVLGLIIGIFIGVIIASVEVMPKYRVIPRVLDKICQVYVAFFRGTPLVVQLLVGYMIHYVPLMFHFPMAGDIWQEMSFLLPMSIACFGIGFVFQAFVTERESVFVSWVVTSLVFLLLSGLIWPRYDMPPVWKTLCPVEAVVVPHCVSHCFACECSL